MSGDGRGMLGQFPRLRVAVVAHQLPIDVEGMQALGAVGEMSFDGLRVGQRAAVVRQSGKILFRWMPHAPHSSPSARKIARADLRQPCSSTSTVLAVVSRLAAM